MSGEKLIQGFSGMSRDDKLRLAASYAIQPVEFLQQINKLWNPDENENKRYATFSENAVSNFYLPYSLAPNFLIDGRKYMIPMVTEESSVVAAASAAAKFWFTHGGFRTSVDQMIKPGHIHFFWNGEHSVIESFIQEITPGLYSSAQAIEKSMRIRGGGIQSITLVNLTHKLNGYYQIEVLFNTVDAMGANFVNSCLEQMSEFMNKQAETAGISGSLDIIMAILSNYTPQCLVHGKVSCPVGELEVNDRGLSGEAFARRFEAAVLIAQHDISRAVTHNKGIYNGVDAVIVATGNDFRAVEAAGHAWASKEGTYKSLSAVEISNTSFTLSISIPLAIGVVGGVTNLHPMAKASLQLLGNPSADRLMSVAASAGLANHFSAVKSLICGGIQKGHMKLHLVNILNHLDASEAEKEKAIRYFKLRPVSQRSVREFIDRQRQNKIVP
jgi:hydroxymethylglutaryl-CoA reductase